MKKYFEILCFCLLQYSLNAYSQSDLYQITVELESSQTFLVNVSIDTIFTGWRFNELGRKYKICGISVNKIYYMADTLTVSRPQLLRAKYMLYYDHRIELYQNLDISMFASDKRDVFFMSGILSEKEIYAQKYHHHAIISSLSIDCRKFSKFFRRQLNF